MRRLPAPPAPADLIGNPVSLRLANTISGPDTSVDPPLAMLHQTAASLITELQRLQRPGPYVTQFNFSQAAKDIDFATESAILVDIGLQANSGAKILPVEAKETADSLTLRFAYPTPDATLPAVTHPYGVFAVPRTTKPVIVQRVSDQEFVGLSLKNEAEKPIPAPVPIPSSRIVTVTGNRITVPGSWVVWAQNGQADLVGTMQRLDVRSPSDTPATAARLLIESLPATDGTTPTTVSNGLQTPIGWPRTSWRTAIFEQAWLGGVVRQLAYDDMAWTDVMTLYRFPPAGIGAGYDRLTLSYRAGTLSEAEALTILDSWQAAP